MVSIGQFEVLDFLKKRRGRFFTGRRILKSVHTTPLAVAKVRKYASFYGIVVKQRKLRKSGSPTFLIGFYKKM